MLLQMLGAAGNGEEGKGDGGKGQPEGADDDELEALLAALPAGLSLKRLVRTVELARRPAADDAERAENDAGGSSPDAPSDAPPPPPPPPRAELPREPSRASEPYQPLDLARFRELLGAAPADPAEARAPEASHASADALDAQPTMVHVLGANSSDWEMAGLVTGAVL